MKRKGSIILSSLLTATLLILPYSSVVYAQTYATPSGYEKTTSTKVDLNSKDTTITSDKNATTPSIETTSEPVKTVEPIEIKSPVSDKIKTYENEYQKEITTNTNFRTKQSADEKAYSQYKNLQTTQNLLKSTQALALNTESILLNYANILEVRVNSSSILTTSDKTTLTSQINAQISAIKQIYSSTSNAATLIELKTYISNYQNQRQALIALSQKVVGYTLIGTRKRELQELQALQQEIENLSTQKTLTSSSLNIYDTSNSKIKEDISQSEMDLTTGLSKYESLNASNITSQIQVASNTLTQVVAFEDQIKTQLLVEITLLS